MIINKRYKVRQVAGENLVIMQPRDGEEMTKVVALNETSLFLWNNLQSINFSQQDAVSLLTSNYNVDEKTAAADVNAWISQLKELGIIEP